MPEHDIPGLVAWLDERAKGLIRQSVAHPVIVLAVIGLLTILAAVSAAGLRVDTDSSKMLSPTLPFQERTHALNNAFPSLKNTILVVVRAETADSADYVTGALVERLQTRSEFEQVFSPSVDPFLMAHGLLYQETEALDRQLSSLSRSANFLAALRTDQSIEGMFRAVEQATRLAQGSGSGVEELDGFYRALAGTLQGTDETALQPLAWGGAVAGGPGESQDTVEVLRVITLQPQLDFTALSPAKKAISAVRDEIAALPPAVARFAEIGVTGDPVLRGEELRSVVTTLPLSFGLSILLVAVMLYLALGTFGRMFLALGALVVSLILTAGFAGAAIGALNLVSVAFIVLMVGLGIDFAIHFLAHLDEAGAREPAPEKALAMTGGAVGGALIIAALTTSLSFLAFATTDFIGMAQLGVIGAAGVAIALAVTLTLIPAVVTLRPILMRRSYSATAMPPEILPGEAPPPLPRRARFVRLAFWPVLVLGLGSLVAAPAARFDADPMGLRNPEAPSVEAYRWLEADPDRTPLRLSVLAPDEATAADLAGRLAALPEIERAVSSQDLVPRDQFKKLDLIDLVYPSLLHAVEGEPESLTQASGDPEVLAALLEGQGKGAMALSDALREFAGARTPERDALLQEAFYVFFPQLLARLTSQLEAGEVTFDDLPATLQARFRSAEGSYRVEAVATGDVTDPAMLASVLDAASEIAPDLAGPLVQINGAAQVVAGAMLQAVAMALLAVLLLAWACLRRLRDLIAVVVPLVLAGGVTLAVSALADIPFNYANVIVLPLMIGIGVDAGVHLAFRTRRAGARVFSTSTPGAILFSALTTIGAFATLILSDHRGTASMGILLTVALISAIVMVMVLTPRLIGDQAR